MNCPKLQTELSLAREKLACDLSSLVALRPLPAIAVRVNKACREQDLDARSLSNLVESDPAFASKVLSVANSSMFGFSREVSSVQQALVVLGRKSVSQLAISVATQKVFSDGQSSEARVNLYEHSLACASVSRTIASEMGAAIDSGAAFLAGMLHDVGKLILLDLAPLGYPALLGSLAGPEGSVQSELENFGTDHTKLGVVFGKAWSLSSPICEAISQHHDSDTSQPLSQVTAVSNRLAKSWGIGQPAAVEHCEESIDWLERIIHCDVDEIRKRSQERFLELKSLLSD